LKESIVTTSATIDQRPFLDIAPGTNLIRSMEVDERIHPPLAAYIETAGRLGGLLKSPCGVLRFTDIEADHVLAVMRFGHSSTLLDRYDSIAAQKTNDVAERGVSTDVLSQNGHQLQGQNIIWRGAIRDGRWVVAYSGAQEIFDEALAKMALASFKALGEERYAQLKRVQRDLGQDFQGIALSRIAQRLKEIMEERDIRLIADGVEHVADEAALKRAEKINARKTSPWSISAG
jgi:hypothetical protein